MIDNALTHILLTSVAISLHQVTDSFADIRDVRTQAQDALPDVDPALVEDLLISAMAKVAGGVDVDALNRLWGAPRLHEVAPRLVEVLDEIFRCS